MLPHTAHPHALLASCLMKHEDELIFSPTLYLIRINSGIKLLACSYTAWVSSSTPSARPGGAHPVSQPVGSRVEVCGRFLIGRTIPTDCGKPRVTTSSRLSACENIASHEIEMCSRSSEQAKCLEGEGCGLPEWMSQLFLVRYHGIPRQSVRLSGSSTETNIRKRKTHLNIIQKLSSYLAENTSR